MKTHGLRTEEVSAVLGDRTRVISALDAALRATDTPANAKVANGRLHCLHRVADLLGAELQMPISLSILDPAEAACMAFTEQWVVDVASMPESLLADLTGHLGDAGVMDFVQALLVEEQRIRLDLGWQRLGLLPVASDHDPSSRLLDQPPEAVGSLNKALSEWQAAVVCLDEVDPITTELVRLRCANYHDCHT